MNGIKFIRTRCNLSIGDLSEILGVTRQAIGSWENGTKQLPKQRAKELSEFFGLHEKYFGELSDADMEELCTMPMYRDDVNGKKHTNTKNPPITNGKHATFSTKAS